MSTATSGRRREYLVRDHMLAHGFELIARSAGSKGPADIIVASEEQGLALVQIGTGNKKLGPADRERLCRAAWLASALPILATVNRGAITYHHVNVGPPAGWAKWTPGTDCHDHLEPEQYCPECGAYNPTREWEATDGAH